jgi:hypothetical protein
MGSPSQDMRYQLIQAPSSSCTSQNHYGDTCVREKPIHYYPQRDQTYAQNRDDQSPKKPDRPKFVVRTYKRAKREDGQHYLVNDPV